MTEKFKIPEALKSLLAFHPSFSGQSSGNKRDHFGLFFFFHSVFGSGREKSEIDN
jgi:hypothetical protein